MKQFINNNSYKEEIKKTEKMARGVFYGSFNKDERIEKELETKIEKWKKDLNDYISSNNPYIENRRELEISKKELEKKYISKKDIINNLNMFKSLDIDTKFWLDKLENNNNNNLNAIKKNIISNWNEVYNKKNNEWTINAIKEKRYKFINDIESWIKLLKRLRYMSNILRIKTGVLWDFRVGELKEEDISLLERWVKFIDNIDKNNYIEKIADSIGKKIDIEKITKNIELKNNYSYTNKKIDSKDEISGIYFSKDIENIIPEELSLLCNEEAEKLFKLKYIENRIMCFDKSYYAFDELDKNKTVSGHKDGKGDMIICIDTSGSMKGVNEYIAKSIMFKILMKAIAENRNAYLINFSTEIYTYKFNNSSGVDELIKFLKLSYYGGSDIYKALYEANRIMKKYNNNDVLVISDFIMEDMPQYLVDICLKQRKDGNNFFAVSIGKFPFGYSYKKVFNRHWVFDIESGIKEIS